jgi:hypothetical protein
VAGQWLLCVTCDDERLSEEPALVPAVTAAATAGAICLARLAVSRLRGETFGTDIELAMVLAAGIAVALFAMRRAGRPRRHGSPVVGDGGRTLVIMAARPRVKAWQAGFPMQPRDGFPPGLHRPASGCSVPFARSRSRQDRLRNTVAGASEGYDQRR